MRRDDIPEHADPPQISKLLTAVIPDHPADVDPLFEASRIGRIIVAGKI